MKNTIKLFAIIAMTAVIGLSMTACNLDPGDDGVPKYLTITGVPTTGTTVPTTGNVAVGLADVSTGGKTTLVAYSEVPVAGTLEIPLLSYKKGNGEPFTGTGEFFILLIFDNNTKDNDNDDVNYIYSNGTTVAVKFDIKEEISVFPFAKFRKIN
jgi:hypothetical protein